MGYRMNGPGSSPGSERFFSSLQHPERLWDPPSLLSNGYRGLFPMEQNGQCMKLTLPFYESRFAQRGFASAKTARNMEGKKGKVSLCLGN
jgi:hypothetical protein